MYPSRTATSSWLQGSCLFQDGLIVLFQHKNPIHLSFVSSLCLCLARSHCSCFLALAFYSLLHSPSRSLASSVALCLSFTYSLPFHSLALSLTLALTLALSLLPSLSLPNSLSRSSIHTPILFLSLARSLARSFPRSPCVSCLLSLALSSPPLPSLSLSRSLWAHYVVELGHGLKMFSLAHDGLTM